AFAVGNGCAVRAWHGLARGRRAMAAFGLAVAGVGFSVLFGFAAALAEQQERRAPARAQHKNGRQDDEEHELLARHLLLARRSFALGAFAFGRRRRLALRRRVVLLLLSKHDGIARALPRSLVRKTWLRIGGDWAKLAGEPGRVRPSLHHVRERQAP